MHLRHVPLSSEMPAVHKCTAPGNGSVVRCAARAPVHQCALQSDCPVLLPSAGTHESPRGPGCGMQGALAAIIRVEPGGVCWPITSRCARHHGVWRRRGRPRRRCPRISAACTPAAICGPLKPWHPTALFFLLQRRRMPMVPMHTCDIRIKKALCCHVTPHLFPGVLSAAVLAVHAA